MPENHFYKIFYLPPFIYISGEFARRIIRILKFNLKPVVAVALAVYFIYVLMSGIIPDHNPKSNPFYYYTERLDRIVSKNDLVILPSDKRYLVKFYRYFGKGEVLRATSRIAYTDYWSEIWPNRFEFASKTEEFFKSRFENILISERAWSQGEEFLMFSRYNFPGFQPIVLMLEKEHLIVEEKVMGYDGQYLKVRIEE